MRLNKNGSKMIEATTKPSGWKNFTYQSTKNPRCTRIIKMSINWCFTKADFYVFDAIKLNFMDENTEIMSCVFCEYLSSIFLYLGIEDADEKVNSVYLVFRNLSTYWTNWIYWVGKSFWLSNIWTINIHILF